MELAPHQRIGSYEVLTPLGSGAMATVYKVRHVQLQAIYALKLLDHLGARLQDRLLQEGRVQATLRHPNIVAVTDILDFQGQPGLVMEYVEGPTLAQYLKQHHPLSADTLDALVRPILRGVRAAHRAGQIHRDIKPSNILVAGADDELIPKVADFGLVKALDTMADATHTRTGALLGSPAYMAPEQTLASRLVDQRADVWALGVTLYQLTTNTLPFQHEDFITLFSMVRAGRFADPRALRPDLPERMWTAMEGAMIVDLGARLGDCDELLAAWDGKSARRRALDRSSETITLSDLLTPIPPAPAPKLATASSSLETMLFEPGTEGAAVAVAPAHDLNLVASPSPVARSWSTESLPAMASSIAPRDVPLTASLSGMTTRSWLTLAGLLIGGVSIASMAGGGAVAWYLVATAPAPAPAPSPAPAPIESAVVEPAPTPLAPLAAEPAPPPTAPAPPRRPPSEPASTQAAQVPATPEPAIAPVEPVAVPGRFSAAGQAEAVWLVSGGTHFDPGELPAGSYTVEARFPGRPTAPIDGLVVQVRAGETTTLSCVAGFFTCKVR